MSEPDLTSDLEHASELSADASAPDAEGISLAPGHLFSADHRFKHHVRINFGHPDHKDFPAALKTVGTIARALAA